MQNTIFSRRRVVTFVCAASVLAACGTTFAAGTVNLNGSTTVLPVMQQVSEAFMQKNPGVVVTISGTGSGNGIKSAPRQDDRCGHVEPRPQGQGKKDFEAHGINPVKIPVALDAIIPVVSPKNAVASLTMEQLRGPLSPARSRTGRNSAVPTLPVVVVGRDSSSGTFESWQELVMGKTRVSQRALLQSSSGGVVQAVAGNPNAIGYIGVGYLDSQIKGLVVNGVQPGAKTAQDGTWPISRELYLFTSGQPQGDAKKLVDYTLSAEGQQFVSKSGFVPLK
ncbi:MAG: PstS family phosphate ABC transporter substrate-binding protein [Sutterella wadsworthensis]